MAQHSIDGGGRPRHRARRHPDTATRPRRTRRTARHVRRLSAAALVLGVLLVAPGAPLIQPSEASWQRTSAAGGGFAAVTIPAPRLTAPCRYVLGRTEIYWNPPPGYSADQVDVRGATRGLGSVLAPLTGFDLIQTTSFDSRAGHYVTSVPTNLLGDLLGLGAELHVSMVVTAFGWESRPASTVTNLGLAAGLGASCANLT